MPTIADIQKELKNENLSPVLKELCYKFLQEKTLSWEGSRREKEWVLRDSCNNICADIIQEDFDLGVVHVNCANRIKLFEYSKFNSFSEAIKFVSFEFMKAGFIVLPPDFEI